MKNVPLSTPSDLSRRTKATVNQASEPKVNKIYPNLNIALATANDPRILATVPNQETKVIIFSKSPLCDVGLGLAHILT